MQLHQLRYLITAAEEGSFRAASQKLYVSQSSISIAVKDLEQETGVEIFHRTSRGTTLTPDGIELVDYARSVIDQVDLMEQRYSRTGRADSTRLVISSQHYSLVVDAFGDFASRHEEDPCEFALRESYTNEIIRDVQELRSDLGIIYLSNYNDRVINRALHASALEFTSLYVARPHIIVSASHPLAGQESVSLDQLEPYYRFEQEQGLESSSYFSEEPLANVPHSRRIVVSDNGTLSTLLRCTSGYALGTGAFAQEGDTFSSIPIETDEVMNVGFICRQDIEPGDLAKEFLALLAQRIMAFDGPIDVTPVAREYANAQGGEDGE